jgi:predicted metal-dependent hydrolase
MLGTLHEVVYDGIRGRSEVANGKIIIRGDEKLANSKIKKILTEYLKKEIEIIAIQKAKIINQKYKKISIRSTVSRWGSCSASGNLSFCWRIVFAPHEVLEYLVSHEVAHLAEMNHSKKFWQIVEQINPCYKISERWLKKNGNLLHLYV